MNYIRMSAILPALFVVGAAGAAEPIEAGQFGKLHAVIKPQAEELKWTAIRWLSDLWQARKLAAEQGKPILLWEMDGHPLACV